MKHSLHLAVLSLTLSIPFAHGKSDRGHESSPTASIKRPRVPVAGQKAIADIELPKEKLELVRQGKLCYAVTKAFSSDSKSLWVGYGTGAAARFDVATGKLLDWIDAPARADEPKNNEKATSLKVEISHSGRFLAVGPIGGALQIVNLDRPYAPKIQIPHAGEGADISRLHFSPDGSMIAVERNFPSDSLHWWKLDEGGAKLKWVLEPNGQVRGFDERRNAVHIMEYPNEDDKPQRPRMLRTHSLETGKVFDESQMVGKQMHALGNGMFNLRVENGQNFTIANRRGAIISVLRGREPNNDPLDAHLSADGRVLIRDVTGATELIDPLSGERVHREEVIPERLARSAVSHDTRYLAVPTMSCGFNILPLRPMLEEPLVTNDPSRLLQLLNSPANALKTQYALDRDPELTSQVISLYLQRTPTELSPATSSLLAKLDADTAKERRDATENLIERLKTPEHFAIKKALQKLESDPSTSRHMKIQAAEFLQTAGDLLYRNQALHLRLSSLAEQMNPPSDAAKKFMEFYRGTETPY